MQRSQAVHESATTSAAKQLGAANVPAKLGSGRQLVQAMMASGFLDLKIRPFANSGLMCHVRHGVLPDALGGCE